MNINGNIVVIKTIIVAIFPIIIDNPATNIAYKQTKINGGNIFNKHIFINFLNSSTTSHSFQTVI